MFWDFFYYKGFLGSAERLRTLSQKQSTDILREKPVVRKWTSMYEITPAFCFLWGRKHECHVRLEILSKGAENQDGKKSIIRALELRQAALTPGPYPGYLEHEGTIRALTVGRRKTHLLPHNAFWTDLYVGKFLHIYSKNPNLSYLYIKESFDYERFIRMYLIKTVILLS